MKISLLSKTKGNKVKLQIKIWNWFKWLAAVLAILGIIVGSGYVLCRYHEVKPLKAENQELKNQTIETQKQINTKLDSLGK